MRQNNVKKSVPKKNRQDTEAFGYLASGYLRVHCISIIMEHFPFYTCTFKGKFGYIVDIPVGPSVCPKNC